MLLEKGKDYPILFEGLHARCDSKIEVNSMSQEDSSKTCTDVEVNFLGNEIEFLEDLISKIRGGEKNAVLAKMTISSEYPDREVYQLIIKEK